MQNTKTQVTDDVMHDAKFTYERQKEIKRLERIIEKIRKELEVINEKFADYEYGTDAFEKKKKKYQKKNLN